MPSKKLIRNILFMLVIVIIGYLNIKEFWVYNEMPVSDTFAGYYPKAQTLRASIFKYGNFFPLWRPYLMSGTPYHDSVSVDVISYIGVLNLILPNAFAAIGLTYILSYLVIGVSMYILGMYIFKDPRYAFISAIVLMLSGYTTSRFGEGTYQLCALSLLPLAFLFLIKAFKEKDWLKNTIICGIIIALQIKVAPDMKVTLFSSLLFALYLFFQLIGKNIKARAIKTALVGIILLTIIFGLTAHYIMPQKEYIDRSARAQNTWEKSSGRKTAVKDLFSSMVEPFHKNIFKIRYQGKDEGPGMGYKIGIFAFLLALFAIYKKPKNKLVLFLVATVLLSISLATASFVFYFLWKYIPPWGSFRYVSRAYVLWSFAGALLAGFGAKCLIESLRDKFKFNKRKMNLAFIIISILIIVNLTIFIRHPISPANNPRCNLYELLENADALNYIKEIKVKNNEIFRVHDWETTGIDWPTDPYTVALDLEHIFGYIGAWETEYMNVYLSLAYRDPAKFWGILNVKYLTSRNPLNMSGFKLIKEFERFESDGKCPPPNQSTWNDPHADAGMKAFGQFLYENEEYLPRAYIVDNSILIAGKHDNIMNAMYMLMLAPNFNPENTVIIHGEENINDYSMEELRKYSAIFLTEGSIDQNSGFLLKQYVDGKGILLPNIVEGQQQISEQDIDNMLQLSNEEPYQIPDQNIITKSFEKKIIKLDKPVTGFLVLSERYSMFDGWTATTKNKQFEILRANGVVSTVYLNNEAGNLFFKYKPKSFVIGAIISIITLLAVITYFLHRYYRRRWSKKIKQD